MSLLSRLLTEWNIRSFFDWMLILVISIFLHLVFFRDGFFPRWEICLSAFHVDDEGNFLCGDIRNPNYEKPKGGKTFSGGDAMLLAWTPWFFLIVFNIIYFSLSRTRKHIPTSVAPGHIVNQNLWHWVDVQLRSIALMSALVTLLGHILKYVCGIPRPSAYAALEGRSGIRSERPVFASFPSGHVAIGYCNCFVFGLLCQRAIDYTVRRHFVSPRVQRLQTVENAQNPQNAQTKQTPQATNMATSSNHARGAQIHPKPATTGTSANTATNAKNASDDVTKQKSRHHVQSFSIGSRDKRGDSRRSSSTAAENDVSGVVSLEERTKLKTSENTDSSDSAEAATQDGGESNSLQTNGTNGKNEMKGVKEMNGVDARQTGGEIGGKLGQNEVQEEYFNGHYWFLLPLWEALYRLPTLCMMIAWGPMVLATYVGVTRIREYWHSDVDCVAGAVLGVLCGYYFGFKRYFYDFYGVKAEQTLQGKGNIEI